MSRYYYVYILTNKNNNVLYIGVTRDLLKRAWEHRSGIHPNSFTKKYNLNKLVYYEYSESIYAAIAREKQLKGGSRQKKIYLINQFNPEWKNLYLEMAGENDEN
ncbi:MAG: GIY-YIG nuclease family protein [Patescibacteria group bacterium]